MLGNVLLLCFFVFFIFGIVGVQLWSGLLRQRCGLELPAVNFSLKNLHVPRDQYYNPDDTSMDYICAKPEETGGMHKCNDLPAFRYDDA
jgi:hypothetical protein